MRYPSRSAANVCGVVWFAPMAKVDGIGGPVIAHCSVHPFCTSKKRRGATPSAALNRVVASERVDTEIRTAMSRINR